MGNAVQANDQQAQRQADIQTEGVRAGTATSGNLSAERMQIMKAKLDEQANMVDITPQIALGLVKATGDKEWMKAIGQKIRADMLLGYTQYGINARMAGKVFKVPHGDKEMSISFSPDDNGELQPQILGEGDRFSPAAQGLDTPKAQADRESKEIIAGEKTSKSSPNKSNDDLNKWFKNADKARKEIMDTFTKKGGMPKSGKVHDVVSFFQGGDPENDAKIAGLKQNYSDYQTAVKDYNDAAEKTGKAPITIDPQVKSAMDKIMALPGAKDKSGGDSSGDQSVVDFLKDPQKNGTGKVVRDTPANRKWAQEQLNANTAP